MCMCMSCVVRTLLCSLAQVRGRESDEVSTQQNMLAFAEQTQPGFYTFQAGAAQRWSAGDVWRMALMVETTDDLNITEDDCRFPFYGSSARECVLTQ